MTARAVADELAERDHDQYRVSTVVELPPAVMTTDSLAAGIATLDRSGGSAVPVLDPEHGNVVGWLTHQAALEALRPTGT